MGQEERLAPRNMRKETFAEFQQAVSEIEGHFYGDIELDDSEREAVRDKAISAIDRLFRNE